MPGITEEMFLQGAMTADYRKIVIITNKLTNMLTTARKARIEKDGAILEMSFILNPVLMGTCQPVRHILLRWKELQMEE